MRLPILLITAVLCAAISFFSFPSHAATELSLVYGSSLPEISNNTNGALPSLAHVLNERRAKGDCAFLFGGGSLGPSMFASLDKGAHLIDILNLMEPDAMQVSKREFIFHEDELSMRASEAFFPLVLSNVLDSRSNEPLLGLEPYVIVRKGDLSLGVINLIGDELLYAYPPLHSRLQGVEEALLTVRYLSVKLRESGVDYIILLTDYAWPHAEDCLAQGEVDIVIANSARKSNFMPSSSGLYVELGSDGGTAVSIQLPSMEAEFINLAEVPPDPTVQAKVDEYLSMMDKILSVELGVTATAFDTLRSNVRSRENAFGNFLADCMRKTMRSDVALINGGVIRGNRTYHAGTPLTRRDVRGELPFQDELAVLAVSGQVLWDALENGLSRLGEESGRFPQVSGMKVTYKPSNPPGKRVISVEVGGKALDRDKTYTLATSGYLADGGDEYTMLHDARRIPSQAIMLSDIARLGVSEAGAISPVLDNRLLALP